MKCLLSLCPIGKNTVITYNSTKMHQIKKYLISNFKYLSIIDLLIITVERKNLYNIAYLPNLEGSKRIGINLSLPISTKLLGK